MRSVVGNTLETGAAACDEAALERRAQAIMLECTDMAPMQREDAQQFTVNTLRYIVDLRQHRQAVEQGTAGMPIFDSRTLLETNVDYPMDHVARCILGKIAQRPTQEIIKKEGSQAIEHALTTFPVTAFYGPMLVTCNVVRLMTPESGSVEYIAQDALAIEPAEEA